MVDLSDADLVVEHATAAPGEKRQLSRDDGALCGVLVVVDGLHPCDRERGHKGAHSFRGESDG